MIRSSILLLGLIFVVGAQADAAEPAWVGEYTQTLSLDECIATAMERNQSRPASRFAVAAAEAQHRQALSAYWPHITLRGAYEVMDQSPTFIFPGSTFQIPSTTFTTPELNLQLEGPGGTPVNIPIDPFDVEVPGMDYDLPDQEVVLQDAESFYAQLEAQWLLWDGGMRKGMREQAKGGIEAARAMQRRTDLEIIDSVTRIYYGAVTATQIRQLGDDTLARMGATLNMTKTMYEEGSGSVKKTDYLNNKIMVDTLRSAVALLEKNEALTQAALAYTIGLSWKESVKPRNEDVPFEPLQADLAALVSEAYAFNPDWARLHAGIRAAKGALKEAKSGHYPKVALTGDLHKWWNDYDKGYATKENKEGWSVSIGVEIPLFSGFLTRNRVKMADALLGEIESKKVLLREGIGLQVRDVMLGLHAAEKRYQATQDAMTTSVENRDLNTRAYQNDLVETEDVIQSQLIEAFMTAEHRKIRYNHAELRSKLNLIVGTEVLRTITEE